MHSVSTFTSIEDAFSRLVNFFSIPDNPSIQRSQSRNGPVLNMREPYLLKFANPKKRVLINPKRDANPFFHLKEALWMLAGRNDVASVAKYASNMNNYSDNGVTLNGAYGYRWRGVGRIDQLNHLAEHLKNDMGSRRAVLQMWNVQEDLLKIDDQCFDFSKDVSCNLGVIFSVSTEAPPSGQEDSTQVVSKLNMTILNRSNDLIWGLLGANNVHFSVLLEYMAAKIGTEVGAMYVCTNNLHVYENNWKPKEWMSHYENIPLSKIADYPTECTPLVKDIETFDTELNQFLDNYSNDRMDWKEPFLEHVAKPAFKSFTLHKQRNYIGAVAYAMEIQSPDWRQACVEWIQRRETNYRNK